MAPDCTLIGTEMMDRKNCWEYMECGREPGGAKVKELGECPAPSASTHTNINRGDGGGRACWTIEETLCEGSSLGEKFKHCLKCPFFIYVAEQEGRNFNLCLDLLKAKA